MAHASHTSMYSWARLPRRAACACAHPRPRAQPFPKSTLFSTPCACEGRGGGAHVHSDLRVGEHLNILTGKAPSSRRLRLRPSTRTNFQIDSKSTREEMRKNKIFIARTGRAPRERKRVRRKAWFVGFFSIQRVLSSRVYKTSQRLRLRGTSQGICNRAICQHHLRVFWQTINCARGTK